MKLAIAVGKVLVLAGWAWGLVAFIAPASVPAPEIGKMVVLGLLAVHVAEAFAFARGLAAEDGRPAGSHVGPLLVFGYFHVLSVRYG